MTIHSDDAARRAYWTEQMQLGYDFVQQLLHFEVRECGERFASLRDAATAENVEMQFATSKIAGNLDRVFKMRESLVDDVMAIGRDMNRCGWILTIEDGYRSPQMQSQLVRKPVLFDTILQRCIWENAGTVPPPEMVFRRAIVLVANIPKIGTHISGSAIDITVLNRDDGSEVWRGAPYLHLDESTPMRSPFVDADALKNRLAITSLMQTHGFLHYPFEFWHYCKGDAMARLVAGNAEPACYGPVTLDPQTGKVAAVADPLQPLNPLPVIEQEIAASLERRRNGTAPSAVPPAAG